MPAKEHHVCARCIEPKLSTHTHRLTLDEETYELHLCDTHDEKLERDLRGWLRMATFVEPPKVFKTALKPVTPPRGLYDETAAPPTRKDVIRSSEPLSREVTVFDGEDENTGLWPTTTAQAAMRRLNLSWPQVCTAVEDAHAIIPAAGDVVAYLTPSLSVLVSEDRHVLGVAERTPGEPMPATPPALRSKIVRKGKRGGAGRIGPQTFEDLVKAVRARDGWSIDRVNNGHYEVRGPQGQKAQVAATASDYRTIRNDISRLRRVTGLDLRIEAS